MVHLEFRVTPFRAKRFVELYGPAVARVLAYGATSYMFYRSDDDSEHFTHASIWEDRADFQRYWFSREMQEVRERIAGLHDQPLLPTWNTILARG
jgi:quinol monooxygenase YgiN